MLEYKAFEKVVAVKDVVFLRNAMFLRNVMVLRMGKSGGTLKD